MKMRQESYAPLADIDYSHIIPKANEYKIQNVFVVDSKGNIEREVRIVHTVTYSAR